MTHPNTHHETIRTYLAALDKGHHPITHHESIRTYLATLDPAITTDLAAAALTGVAAAGALAEWNSETIEHILTPLLEPVAAAGLPPFCDQDEDAEATWAQVLYMPR